MHFVSSLDEHQALRTVTLPGDDLPDGLTGHPLLDKGAALGLQVVSYQLVVDGEINRAFQRRKS